MKRLLSLLALVLCCCAETFVGEEVARSNNETLPDLTAVFAEEDNTRTYIEDGKYLRWHEDDRLTIFYGNTLNRQYKFNGATGDNSGTFSLVPDGMLGTGNAFDRIYALYPYNADVRITDEGIISLTLPAVQNYAENSFGHDANTMLAVTENLEDTFLAFKNACGYLKLKLYNAEGATIKSIEIKGNRGERLAGAATATIAFGEAPVLAMADDATTLVTLDCGEGVALGTTAETATEFWVTLPATTFAEGLTITATDTEGGVFEKSTTNEVIIKRNAIQPMASVEHNASPAFPVTPQIPNNEIWYTSSDGSIVDPYAADAFGGFIISNIYENGKGIIRCFGDITNIGYSAFSGCERLTSIIIPDSVGGIGAEAFAGCSSLLSIDMPDGLGYIEEAAFAGCSSLLSIDMPDGLGYIGDHAFEACSSLLSIDIPNGVSHIGWYAFANCTSLTSILLGNGVKIIEPYAFDNCKSLKRVDITDLEAWCKIDFRYDFYAWFSSNPLSYAGNLYLNGVLVENLVIPESITDVRPLAFHGANCIKSAVIHDGVTSIGVGAFAMCSSMKSVTIGNSVKDIELATFAFSGLENVTIPNSVVKIYDYAFFECHRIGEITIGNNISYIGDLAFYYCNSLTRVNITNLDAWCRIYFDSVESNPLCYANNLYLDGVLLEHLIIPESIAEVGSCVFFGANCLKSVVIHSGVTSIGNQTFNNCYSLKWVYCMATTPPYEGDAFYDNHDERKIYVPMESVEAYKSAEGWSKYADAIVGYKF